ncbi:MAG: DUF4339 domain-containing protein, partial [Planctomycetes bacterium]|nr:DUF4339 domain-containing protein [Planctomycetota bacterium]
PQQPSEPAGRTPVASSRPVAFPSPIESPAAGGPIDPRSPAPAPGATPGGLPPTPSAAVDPLEEAPEAVWYVRPPGGGQFGPAARDVMQGWIDDGRVTPDSLVWREGWRDWQEASAVFTQLGAQQAAPQRGGIGGAETNSDGGAGDGQRVPTRRRPTVLNMAIIAVLALAIVALAVVFIWIMQHSPS